MKTLLVTPRLTWYTGTHMTTERVDRLYQDILRVIVNMRTSNNTFVRMYRRVTFDPPNGMVTIPWLMER